MIIFLLDNQPILCCSLEKIGSLILIDFIDLNDQTGHVRTGTYDLSKPALIAQSHLDLWIYGG